MTDVNSYDNIHITKRAAPPRHRFRIGRRVEQDKAKPAAGDRRGKLRRIAHLSNPIYSKGGEIRLSLLDQNLLISLGRCAATHAAFQGTEANPQDRRAQ